MSTRARTFSLQVDITNPGQFFACCGLLELAHRLWPGAEGWFEQRNTSFQICSEDASAGLEKVLSDLGACEIMGLTDVEKRERDELEKERRQLRKKKKEDVGSATVEQALREFLKTKEVRRTELGTKAREGAVIFGAPFSLTLSWWESEDEEPPKTWAGRQEIHKVARAAQDALVAIADLPRLFDYSCVMRLPAEYRSKPGDEKKAVEPFYFDARRFVHALDTGYSLDVQDAETLAHPAVELLALVGLQRFRPIASEERGVLDYFAWLSPLCASVASAVASGAVWHPDGALYRSRLRYRDNQRRYKAFSPANPLTTPTI